MAVKKLAFLEVRIFCRMVRGKWVEGQRLARRLPGDRESLAGQRSRAGRVVGRRSEEDVQVRGKGPEGSEEVDGGSEMSSRVGEVNVAPEAAEVEERCAKRGARGSCLSGCWKLQEVRKLSEDEGSGLRSREAVGGSEKFTEDREEVGGGQRKLAEVRGRHGDGSCGKPVRKLPEAIGSRLSPARSRLAVRGSWRARRSEVAEPEVAESEGKLRERAGKLGRPRKLPEVRGSCLKYQRLAGGQREIHVATSVAPEAVGKFQREAHWRSGREDAVEGRGKLPEGRGKLWEAVRGCGGAGQKLSDGRGKLGEDERKLPEVRMLSWWPLKVGEAIGSCRGPHGFGGDRGRAEYCRKSGRPEKVKQVAVSGRRQLA
ncbi:hypothetical protein FNV43_RR21400 [Rhamnella rubrinervis]|uniref:Uncharacterized protein n=1 Tax=Rhamnella rubrinervis TaxID=2594499 RepID=A0A8K0E8C7_9ROSA|nr:hypothetical protein FNV43_RR21400 [Rhamnella rubrinervis]